MSYETNLRYESDKKRISNRNYLRMEKKNLELRAQDDKSMELERDFKVMKDSVWIKAQEATVGFKRAHMTMDQRNEEVRQCAKATIRVRRRALEILLQMEHEQYRQELATRGQAIDIQRL